MVEPGNHVEQGGFTAAGVTDYANKFAFGYLQIDIFQNCKRAVGSWIYLRER
jgi:hypothetical protein